MAKAPAVGADLEGHQNGVLGSLRSDSSRNSHQWVETALATTPSVWQAYSAAVVASIAFSVREDSALAATDRVF